MRLIERRIGLLFAAFLLLFVIGLVRAGWLQAVRGGELSADARSQQTETVTVPGERGRVLDRMGRELAVSEDAASVYATPYQIDDPAKAAAKLSKALDRPEEEIRAALEDRDSGFAYLGRQVEARAARRVRNLGLEGVGTLPDSRRVYPQGTLAGQVLGAVGTDGEGLSGLESAHDDLLRGSDGEVAVVRDALGEEISREDVSEATSGEDIRLTLDAEIQGRAEEVVAEVGETYDPAGASVIAVDPRSMDVLAMANWPPLDPAKVSSAKEAQLLNQATGFNYEPGSTFKAFTVGAALQEGVVEPSTVFDLPTEYQVADRTITDAHERGPVSLSVSEILAQSSNVGAVMIGEELGEDRFDEWMRRFGFGEPTGIDYPGEEAGIVPAREDYSGSTIGNLPIGQGVAVTPMQMVAGYAAIANGGRLRSPRLIARADGEPVGRERGDRVLSGGNAARVREMMEGVVDEGGTAAGIEVPGYELAGKTGTAEKAVDGTYSATAFVASFFGFAPAERPRLLIAVIVDEPQGDYYGASVAGPAFADLASFALPYLGIPPR